MHVHCEGHKPEPGPHLDLLQVLRGVLMAHGNTVVEPTADDGVDRGDGGTGGETGIRNTELGQYGPQPAPDTRRTPPDTPASAHRRRYGTPNSGRHEFWSSAS